MKDTFTKKEVILLIRDYCHNQRIICQLPVPRNMYISEEINEMVCKKIRIDADIEKVMPLKSANFEKILKRIQEQKGL